jgi:hypothetical protein
MSQLLDNCLGFMGIEAEARDVALAGDEERRLAFEQALVVVETLLSSGQLSLDAKGICYRLYQPIKLLANPLSELCISKPLGLKQHDRLQKHGLKLDENGEIDFEASFKVVMCAYLGIGMGVLAKLDAADLDALTDVVHVFNTY